MTWQGPSDHDRRLADTVTITVRGLTRPDDTTSEERGLVTWPPADTGHGHSACLEHSDPGSRCQLTETSAQLMWRPSSPRLSRAAAALIDSLETH
jgi:hypothetical protein